MNKTATQMTVAATQLIINDAENHRLDYKEGLTDLEASLEEHGMINPLTVVKQDDKYKVVAGFRRAHAAVNIKMAAVPVVLREANENEQLTLQVIENLVRRDFNAYEMAAAIRTLIDDCNLSREDVAKRLRRTQGWVSQYMGLHDFPDDVQELAKTGSVTVTHIRRLHPLLKKMSDAEISKAAKAMKDFPTEKVEQYCDQLSAKVKFKDKVDVEAKSGGNGDEGVDTAMASVADEDEDADVLTLRGRDEILTAIKSLNKMAKGASSELAKAQLVGRVQALQWVLQDEDADVLG